MTPAHAPMLLAPFTTLALWSILAASAELLPEAYEQARGRGIALLASLTLVGMLLFQRSL